MWNVLFPSPSIIFTSEPSSRNRSTSRASSWTTARLSTVSLLRPRALTFAPSSTNTRTTSQRSVDIATRLATTWSRAVVPPSLGSRLSTSMLAISFTALNTFARRCFVAACHAVLGSTPAISHAPSSLTLPLAWLEMREGIPECKSGSLRFLFSFSNLAALAGVMAPGKKGAGGGEEAKSCKRAIEAPSVTDSPLKKLKAKMQARQADRLTHQKVVSSTVDAFRAFVPSIEHENADVEVRAKFLWASSHNFNNRQVLRLHVTDADPEESLEDLMEFRTAYEATVDEALLTVAVFSETLESPKLPRSGDVIRIANSRKRIVYDGRFCQLVTRLAEIKFE